MCFFLISPPISLNQATCLQRVVHVVRADVEQDLLVDVVAGVFTDQQPRCAQPATDGNGAARIRHRNAGERRKCLKLRVHTQEAALFDAGSGDLYGG